MQPLLWLLMVSNSGVCPNERTTFATTVLSESMPEKQRLYRPRSTKRHGGHRL